MFFFSWLSCSCCFRNVAHSAGVKPSARKAEKAIEMAMVSANCL